MAFAVFDRIRESSTTTGTGNITLAGAVVGYASFASVLTTGDTTYYCIAMQGGGDWEVGLGTFTAPDTLARTTILSSSNSNSIVNFGAGTKDVFITQPAGKTFFNTGGSISGAITVAGQVQSTSGGFKFPDNTVQTTAATGGGGASYQVGQLFAGASAPPTGTWLETGKYYSKATYSGLATVLGNVPDIGGYSTVATPNQMSMPVPTAFSSLGAGYFPQQLSATNGSVWVAVTSNGGIRYTSDGTNWRIIASGTTQGFNGVIYTNSQFIAYGSNVAVSPDGINWTVKSAPAGQGLTTLAYGGGIYVGASGSGSGGYVGYSTDLLTWTQATTSFTNQCVSLIYVGSQFVAASIANSGIITSPDGINWTTQTVTGSTSGYRALKYLGGQYILVGVHIYTSSDTITWTQRYNGTSTAAQLMDVTYNGTLWVAVGYNGGNANASVLTSTDSVTWTTAFTGVSCMYKVFYAVVWTGTKFATGGQYGVYAYSSDGVTWYERNTPSLGNIAGVGVVNGRAIGFANNGATSYIDDDTATEIFLSGTWRQGITVTNVLNIRPVIYGSSQGKYVLASNLGSVFYSSNGVDWFGAVTPDFNNENWDKAFYENGNFFVTGPASGSGRNVLSSSDGMTWAYCASGGGQGITGVAYGAGLYVFAGTGGTITTTTTPSGAQTTRTSGTTQQLNDLIYANSLFVAVGAAGAITTSPDGITWTAQTVGSTAFQRVIYANSLFMAVGVSGVIYTSSNGTTWTAQTSGTTQTIYDVLWTGTSWNAVAGGGVILRSTNSTTWTIQTSGSTETILSIANSGSVLVASNSTNGQVFRSTNDGVTWLRTSTVSGTVVNNNVRYLNGKFIAVGNGFVQSCTDGFAWEAASNVQFTYSTTSKIYKIGSRYFATSAGGLLTSSDGITWTVATRLWRNTIAGVAYNGSVYAALGTATGQPEIILTSTDGVTWTKVANLATTFTAATITSFAVDLVSASGKFVIGRSPTTAQGLTTCVQYSSDGVTWTNSASFSSTQTSTSVLASDGTTVVASVSTSAWFRSTDGGVTWAQLINAPTASSAVVYSNGWWIFSTVATKDFLNYIVRSTISNPYYIEAGGWTYTIANAAGGQAKNPLSQYGFVSSNGYVYNYIAVVASGKVAPNRGNYALVAAGTTNNGFNPLPIVELALYSYDTSTTFFVPPSDVEAGVRSFICAGT